MRANASAITSDFSCNCRSYDDVRVERAAARPIDIDGAPVAARVEHLDRVRKRELLADAIDADAHAFAGNRAGDEHNLPLVPGEHAAAGDRLLDRDDDLGVELEGHDESYRDQEIRRILLERIAPDLLIVYLYSVYCDSAALTNSSNSDRNSPVRQKFSGCHWTATQKRAQDARWLRRRRRARSRRS